MITSNPIYLQDLQVFLQDLQDLQVFLQVLQDLQAFLQDLQVLQVLHCLAQVLQDVQDLQDLQSLTQLLQVLLVALGHAALTSATVIEAKKRTVSKIASPFTILLYVALFINLHSPKCYSI